MQCAHCQQDNSSYAKFCFECGTPVKRTNESSRQEVPYGELRSTLTESLEQQMVAGARNHLQADRSLGFCFEIRI